MPYWRGRSILHLGVRWIMLATAVQFAFYAHPLFANPAGASVVNGAVNMQTSGNTLAITASDRSIINWQGFSIGAGETTQFIQPNAGASVLNRVTSGDASQIMGALQANGQVYLINPNGVFIGNGATINVGSFLASTANVSDESFKRGGNLTFSEASGAGIINRGTITANHGDVFLLAKTVENSGTIQAAQGTVGLMAGTQFFLKKDETGAVKV
ncbi:filamentous hemagglutinin N-terminal domain-containing protein, partial [bacterium]|nr:filamentous hemagglutinin N-terminal domain-containing protein [bacterium]